MIDLIILFLAKLIIQKFLAKKNFKIDRIHILSTIIPIIFYILGFVLFKINFEYFLLVFGIFILGSYILVNVPGAYITSLRIKIFKILYDSNGLYENEFYTKFNDEILFNDRLDRIRKHKIIEERNGKFYLVSKKISLLIWFVDAMRKIYKFVNKY